MDDFNEAVLMISVNVDVAEVYKKAIEAENSPNGLRDNWNGNYAYVVIGDNNIFYQDDKPAEKKYSQPNYSALISHATKLKRNG